MKMNSLYTRIHTIVKHLERARLTSKTYIPELYHKESGYHSWELVHEDPSSWNVFRKGDGWGGKDVHSCFKTRIQIPDHLEGKKSFVPSLLVLMTSGIMTIRNSWHSSMGN